MDLKRRRVSSAESRDRDGKKPKRDPNEGRMQTVVEFLPKVLCGIVLGYAKGEPMFVRHIGGLGELASPSAAVEYDSQVFITEKDKRRVSVFTAEGQFVRHIGGGGGGGAGWEEAAEREAGVVALGEVRDTVVGQDGLLYVADFTNDRVSVFNSSDGAFVRHFGSKGRSLSQLWGPFGVAVTQDELIVADCVNRRVSVWPLPRDDEEDDPMDLSPLSAVGGVRTETMPFAVTQADGLLYVAEQRTVSVYAADGQFLRRIGDQEMSLGGVAVWDGLVYVSDERNNRLSVFRADDGVLVRHYGSQGIGLGEFDQPCHLHVTEDGRLYVAEEKNRRVSVFQL